MKPKDTEKLLELLKKTGSIDAYLQENKDFLLDCNIKEYLRALIREKGITIVQLASDAQLSERYCFQLLSLSKPTPSIQGCSVKYVHRYAAES